MRLGVRIFISKWEKSDADDKQDAHHKVDGLSIEGIIPEGLFGQVALS